MLEVCLALLVFYVSLPWAFEEEECRCVAVGDIHGDLAAAIHILSAAGLVGPGGKWIGGCATLVQLGDIVDRGESSIAALRYFRQLQADAARSGGNVELLLGNHELMNLDGAMSYANPKEVRENGGPDVWRRMFSAGGKFYKELLSRSIVAYAKGTVFVHGGILPSFAALGVDGLNRMAKLQLQRHELSGGVFGNDGPLWNRKVILDAKRDNCRGLHLALLLLRASRMVVGHTVQESGKISVSCNSTLIAIDTGISSAMLGMHSFLEITADKAIPHGL